jgi:hypothetical protein
LQTKLPDEEIKQGELVKIQWELSGTGNLPLVTLPDVKWPKGIDTSEPSVKEDVNPFVYPLSGKKTFNYAVTARDTGQYIIPGISFSYFDPKTSEYKTIVTQPVSFHVSASLKQPFFAEDGISNFSDRYLHLYWFGGVVLVIIGWITYQLVFLKKGMVEEETDSVKKVQKEIIDVPVPLESTDELFQNARKSLLNDDIKGFHREVQQVLWKVAANRCDVLPSFLNKQNITFQLQKQQIPPLVINNFVTVLNECEWALYTPDHLTSDMEELLNNAIEVSSELNKA